MQERVLFLTEGSPSVGFGHVRRCLTLASALRARGLESLFALSRDSALGEQVAAAGFRTRVMDVRDLGELKGVGASLLVLDSYRFTAADFQGLSATGATVAVIDDLAQRDVPVDIVINGSAAAQGLVYRGLPHTSFLLGPEYALLRPEFELPPERVIPDGINTLLITTGGGDPAGVTPTLIGCADAASGARAIDVVIGPLFTNRDDIDRACRRSQTPVRQHDNPSDVRGLMLAADVALSGGGQTLYELAATATPTIAIRMASNQLMNVSSLADAGAILWAGDADDPELRVNVGRRLSQAACESQRAALAESGRKLVDGRGTTRVAQAILDHAGARTH